MSGRPTVSVDIVTTYSRGSAELALGRRCKVEIKMGSSGRGPVICIIVFCFAGGRSQARIGMCTVSKLVEWFVRPVRLQGGPCLKKSL